MRAADAVAPAVPEPFDPCGQLPGPGTSLIEASAGTGKTFTLTSLVARFVASGTPLSAILAVTFTRAATGELRDRIRHRLTSAEAALRRNLEGDVPLPDDDPVVAQLGRGLRPEVEQRQHRLADAVAELDSATIATTHGFCQMVLSGLGTAGDTSDTVTLLDEPGDLVEEVVDDLYLRWMLHPGRPDPGFGRSAAGAAVREAVRSPDIRLVPGPGEDPSGLLARLAARGRQEVARRLADGGLVTYDQLLFRLAETLDDLDRGPIACRRLQDRYQVVLVDEFQDTDPVQWRILKRAFAGSRTTLVLIGDPKQAIYAFRGADVYAYLDAADGAGDRRTLTESWRSDQPLLDATDALLAPLEFGHPGIPFRSVRAPASRTGPGIRGVPNPAPLRLRLVADRQTGVARTTAKGLLQKPALVDWVAADVAADVTRVMESGTEIREPEGWQPVKPSHIAVLTRTNRQAVTVRDALRSAGVPAVVAGLDSVFISEAASHWLRLLEGLQEPSSRSRAASVALTPFVGMAPDEAALAGEERWEAVHERLHRWAAVLSSGGVAGLYRALSAEEALPGRVLALQGGERLITDLGHVAQLLHAEGAGSGLGAPALRTWLAQRIRLAGEEQSGADERSRRLDSDADAVQVLTIHRAKGLEFGLVYCPYMWDPLQLDRGSGPVIFHDPAAAGARTLDVGCSGSDAAARKRYSDHQALARQEALGEDLRVLYVALTRARHQVVLWWGRAHQCGRSPLARLLLARDPGTGEVGQPSAPEPRDRIVRSAWEQVAARAPGLITIEDATGPSTPVVGPEPALEGGARPGFSAEGLQAAVFGRGLDPWWRRASYTSITAAAHGQPAGRVGSEPEDQGIGDEPPGSGLDPVPAGPFPFAGPPSDLDPELLVPALLSGLPAGADVGTFVHRVLERVDFGVDDLEGAVSSAVAAVGRHGAPEGDLASLPAGLAAALSTPLEPLLPGVALRDVRRGDRLDELWFELPLVGGDGPGEGARPGDVTTADIAKLLSAHTAGGGALSDYPERLADPLLASRLRGYLTGSLDLVFRLKGEVVDPGSDVTERWYVADYKTNRLAGPGAPLSAWTYRPAAIDAEMQHRHYPLQALLYLVALHRYLRWRKPGYDPRLHLGGVLYLFLRGMTGPDTPVVEGSRCGVFGWAAPAELVVDLSELLDRGSIRP